MYFNFNEHVTGYFMYEKQVSKNNRKVSEYFFMFFLHTKPQYIPMYCTHESC